MTLSLSVKRGMGNKNHGKRDYRCVLQHIPLDTPQDFPENPKGWLGMGHMGAILGFQNKYEKIICGACDANHKILNADAR